MPYKKGGEAEARGRVRRTAKRRIERLEKLIGSSDDTHERQLFRQQIDTLREQISKTYVRNPLTGKATGFNRDQLRIAVQNLKRSNEVSRVGTSNRARNDFLTQQELNLAESYDFIGPTQSRFTREEVQVFYAATREAWQGLPSTANRNKAILEYYGRRAEYYKGMSLDQFVHEVLALNERAVNRAHFGGGEYVESEQDLEGEQLEEQQPGSADWMVYVESPLAYNAAAATVVRP